MRLREWSMRLNFVPRPRTQSLWHASWYHKPKLKVLSTGSFPKGSEDARNVSLRKSARFEIQKVKSNERKRFLLPSIEAFIWRKRSKSQICIFLLRIRDDRGRNIKGERRGVEHENGDKKKKEKNMLYTQSKFPQPDSLTVLPYGLQGIDPL